MDADDEKGLALSMSTMSGTELTGGGHDVT